MFFPIAVRIPPAAKIIKGINNSWLPAKPINAIAPMHIMSIPIIVNAFFMMYSITHLMPNKQQYLL